MIERVKTKPGVIIDIKDGNLNKPAEQPEKIKSYLQTQNSLNNSSDKSIKTCPHNSEQSSEKKISDADEYMKIFRISPTKHQHYREA